MAIMHAKHPPKSRRAPFFYKVGLPLSGSTSLCMECYLSLVTNIVYSNESKQIGTRKSNSSYWFVSLDIKCITE